MKQKKKAEIHSSGECQCAVCQGEGLESVRAREQELIETYGHSIRYIFDSYETAFGMYPSIFTRGLPETAKHLNLELVLPVDQGMAQYVLNVLGQKIHEGWSVELNTIYQFPEFNEVPIYFERSVQPQLEESLYRVILADPQMKLPTEEGCDPRYQLQISVGQLESDQPNVH